MRIMNSIVWALIGQVGFPLAAQTHQGEIDQFLMTWLKSHGEKSVVTDTDGIGVKGQKTRIRASVNAMNPQKNGSFTCEIEFRIKAAPGKEIVEFVAGFGKDQSAAVNMALSNFMLSSFHVVYRAFINPKDVHQEEQKVSINGRTRSVVIGDTFSMSAGQAGSLDFGGIPPKVVSALQSLKLDDSPHWLKFVYSQMPGSQTICTVTLDNQENVALDSAARGFGWPRSDKFYMAKLFVVVR